MVDDVKFAEVSAAEDHLIKLRVIMNGVRVKPIFMTVDRKIDVQQLRMVGHDAEVCLRRIKVLDQVIPEVPFPDDVPCGHNTPTRDCWGCT